MHGHQVSPPMLEIEMLRFPPPRPRCSQQTDWCLLSSNLGCCKWLEASQREGWSSKMVHISVAKFCTHCATWKGLCSICRRCHAKLESIRERSPQCRFMLQNDGNMWKYLANSVLCFSAFLEWIVSHLFFLLGFATLYLILGFTNHNRNSHSNNNSNDNSSNSCKKNNKTNRNP